MASSWLKARQTKYAAYATTYILVVLAVVVAVNVLADRFNKTYDATSRSSSGNGSLRCFYSARFFS